MAQVKSYSVYPGEYIPLPEVEALLEELTATHKVVTNKVPLNMDEFNGCFKLEIMIPGARREDICIYSNDNILSVAVSHRQAAPIESGMPRIHEFDSALIHRDVLLPIDADIEFITAEYTQGKLIIHIPKTTKPSKVTMQQIVIY